MSVEDGKTEARPSARRGTRAIGGGSESSLVALIASGRTQKDAAKETGIPLRTVARRCADPEFRAEVESARREFLDRALGTLSDSTTAAASALAELCKHRSPWVRLNAGRALLEHATRLREHVALADRIAEVEAMLAKGWRDSA